MKKQKGPETTDWLFLRLQSKLQTFPLLVMCFFDGVI